MSFTPNINQVLLIDTIACRIAEHPAAPGIPYGQEGRAAVVYQLHIPGNRAVALKVFKPRYRLPALVSLAEQIAPFAQLPGLQVCRRTVLTPQRHGGLLKQYPDLTYAVMMPWITGPTWMQVLLEKTPFTPEQSLTLARSFAGILAGMEQRDLAHCDLSGPNILLPQLAGGKDIALVDVEGLYGPGLKQPRDIMSASPGYAHQSTPGGVWGTEADRFAGAVLLAEMLGWYDARVRDQAVGDPGYFAAREVQQPSERYDILIAALREQWGEAVTRLFERAWRSETLWDCPTFGEWLVVLPESRHSSVTVNRTEPGSERRIRTQLQQAQTLEEEGRLAEALDTYRQVIAFLPAGHVLADELELVAQDLESRLATPAAATSSETELVQLFTNGAAAYDRGHWQEAQELLSEVVRRSPQFALDGQSAHTLLAEVERRLTGQQRKLPLWAWFAGLVVLILIGIIGFALRQSPLFSKPIPTGTPTLTLTTIPTDTLMATQPPTATRAPTRTLVPPIRSTSTASLPALTPTREATLTSTPLPRPITPKLTGPAQGSNSKNPVTFSWSGSLASGQVFVVNARSVRTGKILQSSGVYQTSWVAEISGEDYGEWRWTVFVIGGGKTLATSAEGMFWFDPLPGVSGAEPVETLPPETRPTPTVYHGCQSSILPTSPTVSQTTSVGGWLIWSFLFGLVSITGIPIVEFITKAQRTGIDKDANEPKD